MSAEPSTAQGGRCEMLRRALVFVLCATILSLAAYGLRAHLRAFDGLTEDLVVEEAAPIATPEPNDTLSTLACGNTTKAFLLSMEKHVRRRTHAQAVLRSIGLDPLHVVPVPLESPLVEALAPQGSPPRYRVYASSWLSAFGIMRRIADDECLGENESAYIFEDDISLAPGFPADAVMPALRVGFEIAGEVGFVYAGICDNGGCSDVSETRSIPSLLGPVQVVYRRCVGRCGHAFGMTRKRAAALWELSKIPPGLHNGEPTRGQDIIFNYYAFGNTPPQMPVVVAANYHPANNGGHLGMLFQDNVAYPHGQDGG
jgi:hypothetical protein